MNGEEEVGCLASAVLRLLDVVRLGHGAASSAGRGFAASDFDAPLISRYITDGWGLLKAAEVALVVREADSVELAARATAELWAAAFAIEMQAACSIMLALAGALEDVTSLPVADVLAQIRKDVEAAA